MQIKFLNLEKIVFFAHILIMNIHWFSYIMIVGMNYWMNQCIQIKHSEMTWFHSGSRNFNIS